MHDRFPDLKLQIAYKQIHFALGENDCTQSVTAAMALEREADTSLHDTVVATPPNVAQQ